MHLVEAAAFPEGRLSVSLEGSIKILIDYFRHKDPILEPIVPGSLKGTRPTRLQNGSAARSKTRKLGADLQDLPRGGTLMTSDTSANFDLLSLSEAELVDQACERFETEWRSGVNGPHRRLSRLGCRSLSHGFTQRTGLARGSSSRMKGRGEVPTAEEYRVRFPDRAHTIDEIFSELHEASQGRSTLPDSILGSAVPNPDAPTLDATTVNLDPSKIAELATLDGSLGRLFGDYVILDRLGSGGMGVVYRAFQRKANRLVALKLIKADWCGDLTDVTTHEAEKRFQNEAQTLGQLEHDHIVPLYDVGQAEGLFFFSMRLIKGRSLGQMILSDGPLAARRARVLH